MEFVKMGKIWKVHNLWRIWKKYKLTSTPSIWLAWCPFCVTPFTAICPFPMPFIFWQFHRSGSSTTTNPKFCSIPYQFLKEPIFSIILKIKRNNQLNFDLVFPTHVLKKVYAGELINFHLCNVWLTFYLNC